MAVLKFMLLMAEAYGIEKMGLSKDLWSVNMNDQFVIELVSDLDYEGMVVEISFENETIIALNYDKGIDHIEVEINFDTLINKKIRFSLEKFLNTIEKAKKILIKCYREDQQNRT